MIISRLLLTTYSNIKDNRTIKAYDHISDNTKMSNVVNTIQVVNVDEILRDGILRDGILRRI